MQIMKKIAIVTGASDGVGYHTALGLAKEGYHVIMACRNLEKAHQKRDAILNTLKGLPIPPENPKLTVEQLDLANIDSVERFATKMLNDYKNVSLLINNAGSVTSDYTKTKDGFEKTMQINYLSPFLLTQSLFPLLVADGDARIIQVGSFSHTIANHKDNILFESMSGYQGENYSSEKAYANSKFAMMTFCFELARRIKEANLPIKCLSATPGATKTNIVHQAQDNFLMKLNHWLTMNFGHSAEKGAEPYLYAALDPTVKSGEYYGPACLFGLFGSPAKTSSSSATHNHELASNLWKQTEALMGITFDVNSSDFQVKEDMPLGNDSVTVMTHN
jgi:NAD(P)-dependent dehydrogenase (short-subunit alcohol dehydrogenase family)